MFGFSKPKDDDAETPLSESHRLAQAMMVSTINVAHGLSHALHDRALHRMPENIVAIRTDGEGVMLSVNEAATLMFGGDVSSENIKDLLYTAQRKALRGIWLTMVADPPKLNIPMFALNIQDDALTPVEVLVTRVDPPHEPLEILFIIRRIDDDNNIPTHYKRLALLRTVAEMANHALERIKKHL